ncbi:MurR/RpiR family transcriptional regulator [Mycoplasma mycoides]|uniref:MurR/RpiR family transcriptional regulator n=1 Tax=Mycoplasma mycoides TaxID=2102 RepID=UPI002736022C|nr:SIS domain-containing protein [Mycoplasma mycoides]MDP4040261.1 SIS domain-containing protein [Mycoplasma mycoides]MDP4041127.1 SIS domain-containing protein [Mycoplasma mycoides]MDP4042079.1 SIS domain-containing protein [Mycoplasma mycoides]MDP4043481.1 SIS domain-containing protein [Mycoplasma mycoides]MDP4044332.1 SIS domain-containing protein [Mycoplasma mycoides]
MNIIEKIKQNKINLSPQELKVCDYILTNISDYHNFSVKSICKKLNVQPSVITKTLVKLEIGGLKQLISYLENNSNFFKDETKVSFDNIIDEFENRLEDSLKQLKTNLDINYLKEVVCKILSSKKIILFCTGKTKILANFLFFQLLELNLSVELFSNLFDSRAYNVEQACIIVISTSGNNSKINRYLNFISKRKPNTIIGITSSPILKTDIKVDYHIHGSENNFFINDNRSNPMIEKYKIQYILDLIFLLIINQIDLNNLKFQEKVKTTNLI